jgi:hypothetical protein
MQDAKTDQIHVLVNSRLTNALRAQVAALLTGQAALREVARLRELAGGSATAETLAAIAAVDVEMAALNTEIEDRINVAGNAAEAIERDPPK